MIIDTEKARRIGITSGFQVCQHPGGEPAARIPGTADGVTDPDNFPGVVTATERLLSHPAIISPAAEALNPPGSR